MGLTYDLDKQTTTLLKFALSRASLRLRFIRFVAGSFSDKVWHIRRLVIPMFSWCGGGFASLPSSDLTFLRKGIRQVFQRQLLHDTPDCVLSEILGWPTCPSFASQWAAILAGIRLHCVGHSSLTDPALQQIPWFPLLPQSLPLLRALGWRVTATGDFILRADVNGVDRSFALGV